MFFSIPFCSKPINFTFHTFPCLFMKCLPLSQCVFFMLMLPYVLRSFNHIFQHAFSELKNSEVWRCWGRENSFHYLVFTVPLASAYDLPTFSSHGSDWPHSLQPTYRPNPLLSPYQAVVYMDVKMVSDFSPTQRSY
jgi:hypothetical protein